MIDSTAKNSIFVHLLFSAIDLFASRLLFD